MISDAVLFRPMALLDFSVVDLITAIVAVASLIAIIVGLVIAYKELHHLREQMREGTFLAYSQKYNEIMKQLPFEIFRDNFDTAELDQHPQYRYLLRSYVDLCSEEVKLACRDKIPPLVWQDWEEEIRIVMNSPTGKWVQTEFDFDREYRTFGLFLRGQQDGLRLACDEYSRPKTYSNGRLV